MIEVTQTITEKGKGNCFTACIASIFELPIEQAFYIESENETNYWRDELNKWLQRYGLFFIDVQLTGTLLDELVQYWGYHIITGFSPRDENDFHSVVGFRGEIIFDPHPDRSGLTGPPEEWAYGFFIPKTIFVDKVVFSEKKCLQYNPFEVDFGKSGEIIEDKIMTKMNIKNIHNCSMCGNTIKPGERFRATMTRFEGNVHTYSWCSLCCLAMTRDDGGHMLESRSELIKEKSNNEEKPNT